MPFSAKGNFQDGKVDQSSLIVSHDSDDEPVDYGGRDRVGDGKSKAIDGGTKTLMQFVRDELSSVRGK
ncbi:uncharacterized protein N7477_009262 [Penicillium maclennaniae]|uniref:uncharacterized protein n=1 Tax=Penicillium maclennaniae TaxID=1343394 RepID=UPI00253FA966|nr:uncharacterized protein N7477_009262 [Penicillium maclennaniae]KAJ5661646.1 hypothetical protein N7477_009262 [Penicillium maclennaniae]